MERLFPILNAKLGDEFAHATDRGNYLNPKGWFDRVIYKGRWDPETSDKALLGCVDPEDVSKGWLIFHWAHDNTGNKRMLYQAGGMNSLVLFDVPDPDVPLEMGGGVGIGIALPLESCWGFRKVSEFTG